MPWTFRLRTPSSSSPSPMPAVFRLRSNGFRACCAPHPRNAPTGVSLVGVLESTGRMLMKTSPCGAFWPSDRSKRNVRWRNGNDRIYGSPLLGNFSAISAPSVLKNVLVGGVIASRFSQELTEKTEVCSTADISAISAFSCKTCLGRLRVTSRPWWLTYIRPLSSVYCTLLSCGLPQAFGPAAGSGLRSIAGSRLAKNGSGRKGAHGTRAGVEPGSAQNRGLKYILMQVR